MLSARHVVFFVTDAMLQSARGWCVLELAYAEILDANLQGRGGKLAHAFLPLFLVEQGDPRLPRTVWQAVRDRGHFMPKDSTLSTAAWCQREIRDFLRREQQKCNDVNDSCRMDGRLAGDIDQTPGLLVRVTRFQPRRVN